MLFVCGWVPIMVACGWVVVVGFGNADLIWLVIWVLASLILVLLCFDCGFWVVG